MSASESVNIGAFLSNNTQELATNFTKFARKEAKKWGRVEELAAALKAALPSSAKQLSVALDQLQ